ncbi:hypothetical protein FB451DRAFT_1565673 [Mycena latifolia]|nr:hypothetical protein FB451DRAFT_1565673 [Mycena latifolia]
MNSPSRPSLLTHFFLPRALNVFVAATELVDAHAPLCDAPRVQVGIIISRPPCFLAASFNARLALSAKYATAGTICLENRADPLSLPSGALVQLVPSNPPQISP